MLKLYIFLRVSFAYFPFGDNSNSESVKRVHWHGGHKCVRHVSGVCVCSVCVCVRNVCELRNYMTGNKRSSSSSCSRSCCCCCCLFAVSTVACGWLLLPRGVQWRGGWQESWWRCCHCRLPDDDDNDDDDDNLLSHSWHTLSATPTRAGEAKGGEKLAVRREAGGNCYESPRNSVSPHHNVGNLLYF